MTEETAQLAVVFLHFQACACVHGILCISKLLKILNKQNPAEGKAAEMCLTDQTKCDLEKNQTHKTDLALLSRTKPGTAYSDKQRRLLQQGDMPSENPPTQTLSRARELFLPLRHYWSTSHFPLHPALTWHLFYIITVRHKQEPHWLQSSQ